MMKVRDHLNAKPNGQPRGLDEAQVFCPEQLLNRCLGKHEFAERVVVRLLNSVDADLCQMEAARQAGDASRLARIAHRLKGSFGNIAANRLHVLMGQIESLSRGHKLSLISELLQQMRDEIIDLKKRVEQWRQNQAEWLSGPESLTCDSLPNDGQLSFES